MELGGAIELHAAFRKESRTSLPSVSAALQEIRESPGPFRGFLPRKTTPRDLYQAKVIAKPLNDDIRLSGEPHMTPNRQSPAYALFARRPSCHSRRVSSLRIHPPARKRSRRPVPKTPPSPSARFPRRPPPRRRLLLSGLARKPQKPICTQGCGPQILSAFVKQRTYQPLAHR